MNEGISTLEETPKRIRINLWVTPTTHKFLEFISTRDGRSMSDVIREALRDYALKDAEFSSIVEKIDARMTNGRD